MRIDAVVSSLAFAAEGINAVAYRNPVTSREKWACRYKVVALDSRKQRWGPRGHILKSFASKIKSLALASRPQVLENCPVLSSRTTLFWNC